MDESTLRIIGTRKLANSAERLAYDQHSTSPSLIAIFWGNSSELQAGVSRNATYLKIAAPIYIKIAHRQPPSFSYAQE